MSGEKQTEPLKIESVARFLLSEKLLLTALELYSESLHKGNELPVLRNFFNNPGKDSRSQTAVQARVPRASCRNANAPHSTMSGLNSQRFISGNFEQLQVSEPLTPLPRTSSVQTLESLDLTRYSEDGEGLLSEKVLLKK